MRESVKATIEILGESYSIKCQETALEKLDLAARELARVCTMVQQGDAAIPRDRILVVAALNLASRILETKHDQQTYQKRVQLLSDKIELIE